MPDIAGALYWLLRAVGAPQVTNFFILLILGVFLWAVFDAYRARHSRFLENAPTLMTSLGILGTFVGVVIGLLDFDTADLDSSTSRLLDGLKTAFTTSLVGISAGISFKLLDSIFLARRRDADADETSAAQEIGPAEIHKVLLRQSVALESLRGAIVGSEEGSLLSQSKLLRADISDFARKDEQNRKEFSARLWSELEQFAQMLSRSATEAVIDALKQVIADFNKNLTEQFGENFKQLNEAVHKMVTWQEQYRVQVDELYQLYRQGVTSLGETATSVEHVREQCADIPTTMDKLQEVLQTNQHQIGELTRHLDAFAAVRDRAVESVPAIQGQLDEIGAQLKKGAADMAKQLLEGSAQFSDSINSSNTALQSMVNTAQQSSEQIANAMTDSAKGLTEAGSEMLRQLGGTSETIQREIKNTVEASMQSMTSETTRALGGVREQVQKTLDETGRGLEKQLSALDSAVSQELNRVLQQMGQELAAITGQFSSDYRRLVDEMDRVLRTQPRQN
tara:strand:+ start:200 stop:1723 length:1524 start_codon:yes stop_codon:yes gene_type:complete